MRVRGLARSAVNSILARIVGLTLGLLLVAFAALAVVMQTPLSDRVSDRVIAESGRGIAELVWLLESSPPEAERSAFHLCQPIAGGSDHVAISGRDGRG